MRDYLLFAGHDYEAMGGMNDFVGDFDSVQNAVDYFVTERADSDGDHLSPWDWGHIVYRHTMKIVQRVERRSGRFLWNGYGDR